VLYSLVTVIVESGGRRTSLSPPSMLRGDLVSNGLPWQQMADAPICEYSLLELFSLLDVLACSACEPRAGC
jgi:hypothetical protein